VDVTSVSFNVGLAAAEEIGLISTVVKGSLIDGYYTRIGIDGPGENALGVNGNVGSTASS
jgi:hypothetical protein